MAAPDDNNPKVRVDSAELHACAFHLLNARVIRAGMSRSSGTALKRRGFTKANKSMLLRLALSRMNIETLLARREEDRADLDLECAI